MKKIVGIMLATALVLAFGVSYAFAQAERNCLRFADAGSAPLSEKDATLSLEGYGAQGALEDTDLTVYDMLVYAAQDEYLAHGVYNAVIDSFGNQRPYGNIVQAEATHLSLLKELFAAYGLEFPNDDSAEHIVAPASLLEAAQAGVQAEIDNIAMYSLFMENELPDDIMQVFAKLESGSQSHLMAFQRQVNKLS